MGGHNYSQSDRFDRATSQGYKTKSVNEIFEQNIKRMIHESMDPKKALLRECRDSEVHPQAIPIILGLDVTGSMQRIPHNLIQEGLPKLMGNIIEHGGHDASLLFLAIGDHLNDKAPLQVGQFESGDAELDMWLTRTWLEGNGGGNGGESYLVAWYYALNHVLTDHWIKRKQKGFLITVGDEPCHQSLSRSAISELMGSQPSLEANYTWEQLYKQVSEKWNVHHLHVAEHGTHGSHEISEWKDLLGERLHLVDDYTKIPDVISNIVTSIIPKVSVEVKKEETKTPEDKKLRL